MFCSVRITLHRWFDMMKASKPVGWFWLPVDLNILVNMHDTVCVCISTLASLRTNVTAVSSTGKSGKFDYQLISLPDMKASWSLKHYAASDLGPFDPKLVKHSVYPFNDLPHFELHVPFHFVIVNTGKKLLQLYGMDAINFEIDFPFLMAATKNMMRAVRNIYVAWIMATPDPKWLNGEDYDDERQAAAESLAPWDSASYLNAFEPVDELEVNEEDENKSFVDDEDNEYEDEEFFEGLKQWASDVWTATHSDSASDSEVNLVGGTAAPVLCKGVDVATSETPPLLSVQ